MTSREEFYKNLHKVRSVSAALFFDEKGKILIVKPSYRDDWLVAGGHSEEGESPRQTCKREIKEELGLDIEPGKLLCIDYLVEPHPQKESFEFIFEGGVLSREKIKNIELEEDEIEEYKFVQLQELSDFCDNDLIYRIKESIKFLKGEKDDVYIENKYNIKL
ncbi:MAG: NUDIX hydrolase [Candidatus Spechtbacterales bacterium]|nr:NUDIX hydrolase [Candidatus Spechtbacterales bacterium]